MSAGYGTYALGDLLTILERLRAKHYFNWSNADQVDGILVRMELRRRAAELRRWV